MTPSHHSRPDPCAEARLGASLALDGVLDDLGRARLRRHLRSCPGCARAVERMWASTRLLRAQPLARHRVRARLHRRHRARPRQAAIALGAAAALVLALSGSASLDRREPPGRVLGSGGLELPLGQRSAVDDFAPAAAGTLNR